MLPESWERKFWKGAQDGPGNSSGEGSMSQSSDDPNTFYWPGVMKDFSSETYSNEMLHRTLSKIDIGDISLIYIHL